MGYSKYPNELDDSSTLPPAVDLVTPVRAEVVNRLRDAIISVQTELGTAPSGTNITVKDRLDIINSQLNSIIGELSGNYAILISSGDVVPAFLEDKLVAGTNVVITKLDPGGNEQLEISFNSTLEIGDSLILGASSFTGAPYIQIGELYADTANPARGTIPARISYQNVIPQSGADNLVMSGGINYASNGSRILTTEPAIAWQFELNYDVNSDGEDADNVAEAHFGEYRPANGISANNRRWLSCQINLTTHAIHGGAAGRFDVTDSLRITPAFTVNDGGTTDVINQLRLMGGSGSQVVGSTGDIRSHANFALVCVDDEGNDYPTLSQNDDEVILGDLTNLARSGIWCNTDSISLNIAGNTEFIVGDEYIGIGSGTLAATGKIRAGNSFTIKTLISGSDVVGIDLNGGNATLGQDDSTHSALLCTTTAAFLNVRNATKIWATQTGMAVNGATPSGTSLQVGTGCDVLGNLTAAGTLSVGTVGDPSEFRLASLYLDSADTGLGFIHSGLIYTNQTQIGRDNLIYKSGINAGQTGISGRSDSTMHGAWFSIEYNVDTGADGYDADNALRWHLPDFYAYNGANARPITGILNLTTLDSGIGFGTATPVLGFISSSLPFATPLSVGATNANSEIRLSTIDGVPTRIGNTTGTVQAGNDNIVTIYGLNVDSTGTRIYTDRHAWWVQLEYEFFNGSARLTEAHFCEYRSADGLTNRRPISTTINISNHVPNVYLAADTYILDWSGTNQLIKMYDGGTTNIGFLEQKGAGGWISVANGSYFALVSSTTTHATLFHDSDIVVLRASKNPQGLEIRSVDDVAKIKLNNTGIGFYNTTPVAKPTVAGTVITATTGTALRSLLDSLDLLGLINDTSTDV